MQTLEEVLDAVRELGPSDRARLFDALWDEVSPNDWPPPSAEWIAEAQRRSAEFDAGKSTASSWEEVRARVRRSVGLDD